MQSTFDGVEFGPLQDITTAVEQQAGGGTRLRGQAVWSKVKVTCATLDQGIVDDTDGQDVALGPDPFPVIPTIDITFASTQATTCDFSCSGGAAACCSAGAGEPAMIFTMNVVGAGSDPQLVDSEYEVYIDFGEEGLADATEEPGLAGGAGVLWTGTADRKLSFKSVEKKGKKSSPFAGLDQLEQLSGFDQSTGSIEFVIPVAELQAAATAAQAAASGLDQQPFGRVSLLVWFRTKNTVKGRRRDPDIIRIDRAPNTEDNLEPTIVGEALPLVIFFEPQVE